MKVSLDDDKSKIIIRWVIISICIVISIFFLYQLTTYMKLQNNLNTQIQSEKKNFMQLSNRIDSIEVLIDKIQTDSLFIEKLARENLGMVKKGEKVFKFKNIDNSKIDDRKK